MTLDEVRQLLVQPEGSTLEFKQRWTRDTPKEIVAMANGRGGTIILGVSNALPRQIIGLEESFDEVEGMTVLELRDKLREILNITADHRILLANGSEVLAGEYHVAGGDEVEFKKPSGEKGI